MNPDSLSLIAPAFAELVADGTLKILSHVVDNSSFGDSVSILDASGFLLKIHTDRGQCFVEIGRNGTDWHKLEYAIEFVNPALSQESFGEPPQPDRLASAVKGNRASLSNAMNSQEEVSAFLDFESRKTADLTKKIFGS